MLQQRGKRNHNSVHRLTGTSDPNPMVVFSPWTDPVNCNACKNFDSENWILKDGKQMDPQARNDAAMAQDAPELPTFLDFGSRFHCYFLQAGMQGRRRVPTALTGMQGRRRGLIVLAASLLLWCRQTQNREVLVLQRKAHCCLVYSKIQTQSCS